TSPRYRCSGPGRKPPPMASPMSQPRVNGHNNWPAGTRRGTPPATRRSNAMPNMTLEQFLNHVADVHRWRRAAGVAKVYFMHDTLTPGTVRWVWEDVPLPDVPGEGDVLDM